MNEFASRPYSFSFSFLSVPHVEALFFLLGLAMQMFSKPFNCLFHWWATETVCYSSKIWTPF